MRTLTVNEAPSQFDQFIGMTHKLLQELLHDDS